MSQQSDIIRAACLLIERHGAGATHAAHKRAQELGPHEPRAAATWEHITSAIRIIENEAAAALPPALPLPDRFLA